MDLTDKMKLLSPLDFAALGMNVLAFVKPVALNGKEVYEIHAADGTKMAVADAYDLAFAAIVQHDLQPLSVH